MIHHFRIARHTKDIDTIKEFYSEMVGLNVLGEFDHEGYKGVLLGLKSQTWHLEFTMSDKIPEHNFDDDDLLVFYIEDEKNYIEILERFKIAGVEKLESSNPYWDRIGATYIDPEGYRIVICNKSWEN